MKEFLLASLKAVTKIFNIVFDDYYLHQDNFNDYIEYLQFVINLSEGQVSTDYLENVFEKNVYLDNNYVKNISVKVLNFIYTVVSKKDVEDLNSEIFKYSSVYPEFFGAKRINFEDILYLLDAFDEDDRVFYYLYCLTLYLLLTITSQINENSINKINIYKKEIRDKIEKSTFFW